METESSKRAGTIKAKPPSVGEYLDDIARMLGYCRDQGIALPEDLAKKVSELQDLLESGEREKELLPKALRVHGQLVAMISPATPGSLAATDLRKDNKNAHPTFLLIGILLAVAIIGLVGYVMTVSKPSPPEGGQQRYGDTLHMIGALTDSAAIEEAESPQVPSTTSVEPSISQGKPCSQWNYLFAAMLGAAFNGMLISYGYLRRRTFERRYVPIYLIRMVIGVVAGMILANIGSDLIKADGQIARLGPGMIALVGGYSAEAVRQILDRLVEVLVTAVRGKDTAAQDHGQGCTENLPDTHGCSGLRPAKAAPFRGLCLLCRPEDRAGLDRAQGKNAPPDQ